MIQVLNRSEKLGMRVTSRQKLYMKLFSARLSQMSMSNILFVDLIISCISDLSTIYVVVWFKISFWTWFSVIWISMCRLICAMRFIWSFWLSLPLAIFCVSSSFISSSLTTEPSFSANFSAFSASIFFFSSKTAARGFAGRASYSFYFAADLLYAFRD